jgi:maltose/moltooligosaccharide transporter
MIIVNLLVFILGMFIDFFEIAFIVIPMLIQSVTLPLFYKSLLGGDARNVVLLAGALLLCAAVATLFVRLPQRAAEGAR